MERSDDRRRATAQLGARSRATVVALKDPFALSAQPFMFGWRYLALILFGVAKSDETRRPRTSPGIRGRGPFFSIGKLSR
jgi:hypothetical protein